jgi:hypothetical protein
VLFPSAHINQLRRGRTLEYPTENTPIADVRTGEIAGRAPGVPSEAPNGIAISWPPRPRWYGSSSRSILQPRSCGVKARFFWLNHCFAPKTDS